MLFVTNILRLPNVQELMIYVFVMVMLFGMLTSMLGTFGEILSAFVSAIVFIIWHGFLFVLFIVWIILFLFFRGRFADREPFERNLYAALLATLIIIII